METLKYIFYFFATTVLAFSSASFADTTFFHGKNHLLDDDNPNRQSESWATCAVSYDLSSAIVGVETAAGKQLAQMANGAEVAVMMTYLVSTLGDKSGSEAFNSNLAYAKVLMKELPETRRTSILAEFELAKRNGKGEEVIKKLASTTELCAKNSETQQVYIDTYREMIKIGLLTVPVNQSGD